MSNLFSALFDRPQASRSGPETILEGRTTRDPAGTGGTASRKQLLAVVLKETLLRNNVPPACLGMEFFRTMDRSGARTDGIHVRLLVREEHPELPARMLALERDFRRRVTLVDYRAVEWLQGVSWQFDMGDEAQAPELAGATAQDVEPAPAMPAADSMAPAGPMPVPRQPRARPQESRGLTFAATEPAPL